MRSIINLHFIMSMWFNKTHWDPLKSSSKTLKLKFLVCSFFFLNIFFSHSFASDSLCFNLLFQFAEENSLTTQDYVIHSMYSTHVSLAILKLFPIKYFNEIKFSQTYNQDSDQACPMFIWSSCRMARMVAHTRWCKQNFIFR